MTYLELWLNVTTWTLIVVSAVLLIKGAFS